MAAQRYLLFQLALWCTRFYLRYKGLPGTQCLVACACNWGREMIEGNSTSKMRRLSAAVLVLAGIGLAAAPANAGGVSPGAAVGIGLGAFALGTAVGSAPYYGYGPYYGPYAYYPPPAYYPPVAYPYAPRGCWDPYYRRYYAC
jgi:hypothetical protein